MTAVVWVLCSTGVVVGTDSSATSVDPQLRTIEPSTENLHVIGRDVIVAGTGQIGLDQRFCAVVDRLRSHGRFKKEPAIDVAKKLCKEAIDDFASTYVKLGEYGALVAFPAKGKAHLCKFSVRDFQPELKTARLWYSSMGSCQAVTGPFLDFMREVFWHDGLPSLQDAVFAVTWTLDHAITLNADGVNGPARVAVLGLRGPPPGRLHARILDDDDLSEHRQHISQVKDLLREHQRTLHQGLYGAPSVSLPGDSAE